MVKAYKTEGVGYTFHKPSTLAHTEVELIEKEACKCCGK